MATGPTMRVTSQTTAQELLRFSDQLEDGQRLKGKENKDGSITLYAASGDASGWSKLTGKADKRSDAARHAIELAITSNPVFDHRTVGDIKALVGVGRTQPPSTNMLGAVARYMEGLERDGLAATRGKESPGFSELPIDTRLELRNGISELSRLLGGASQDKPAYDTEVAGMARSLADALGNDPLAKTYPQAILSDGKDIVTEIRNRILEGVPEGARSVAVQDAAQHFAERVFSDATDLFLGGKTVPDSTDIMIGDTRYERQEFIGKGAFGTAYRYESQSGESIAVKFPNNDDPKTLESFREEIPAHKQAGKSGHENILGFKAAMRTENGQLAIATELANKGNVFEAIPKIQTMIKDGNIDPDVGLAMQLTIIRDMVAGISDLHGSSGMTHLDFKTPNAFISGDGKVKVADFGTTVRTENPFLESATGIDNPAWKGATVLYKMNDAPELTDHLGDVRETTIDDIAKSIFPKGIVDGKMDETAMTENYGGKAFKFVSGLGDIQKSIAKNEYFRETEFDGVGYDMFALGVSAFGVLSGDIHLLQNQDAFMSQIEEGYSEFVQRGELAFGDHEGALRPSTGSEEIDSLLNALTHPDSSQRPHDFDALLNMPVFDLPYVGSDDVRELLVAVLDENPDRVSELNTRFD